MTNVYRPGLLQIRPQYAMEPDAPDHPENVLWFLSNTHTTPGLSDLTSIGNRFDLEWRTLWEDFGATAMHYLGSITTDWSSNTGLQYSSVGIFDPDPGTQGTATPPQVAGLISLHVPFRYRGGHPRIYLPYLGVGAVGNSPFNDQLAPATITAIQTDFGNVITRMSSSGFLGGQIMVAYLHRTSPDLANPTPFSSFTVQPQLATQRRRIRKTAHR